jgi:uncharacterized protein (TIGR02996 family)
MNEREQLLAAIRSHPEEDTPRLVFADWLDENGEPDRAAFIRAHVRVHALQQDAPGRYAQLEVIRQTWEPFLKRWHAELPVLKGVEWSGFRRGFVEAVTVASPETFVKFGARIMAAAPVTDVWFREREGFERLAAVPAFARVRTLHVEHGRALTDAQLCPVLRSPHCPRLTGLHIGFERLGSATAVALAESPHMGELRELVICGNNIGDAGMAALAASPYLTGLRAINAHTNGIGAAGALALAASRTLGGLTDLHFGDGIGPDGARALAESSHLTHLRALTLQDNRIGPVGVAALAGSPNFANLELLQIRDPLGPVGGTAIAHSPYLTQLRTLILFACGIGDEGTVALANSPNVARLGALNLTRNDLTDIGAEALARSPYLAELRPHGPCLFDNNRISAAGWNALRARFHRDPAPPVQPVTPPDYTEGDDPIPF